MTDPTGTGANAGKEQFGRKFYIFMVCLWIFISWDKFPLLAKLGSVPKYQASRLLLHFAALVIFVEQAIRGPIQKTLLQRLMISAVLLGLPALTVWGFVRGEGTGFDFWVNVVFVALLPIILIASRKKPATADPPTSPASPPPSPPTSDAP